MHGERLSEDYGKAFIMGTRTNSWVHCTNVSPLSRFMSARSLASRSEPAMRVISYFWSSSSSSQSCVDAGSSISSRASSRIRRRNSARSSLPQIALIREWVQGGRQTESFSVGRSCPLTTASINHNCIASYLDEDCHRLLSAPRERRGRIKRGQAFWPCRASA